MKKMTAVLLACSFLSNCADRNDSQVKVFNGSEINHDEFPATVKVLGGGLLCSGTFISTNKVLTAAHCVPSHDKVVIYKGRRIGVIAVDSHPAYSGGSSNSDLAVLTTSESVADYVIPCSNKPDRGSVVTFVGFGNDGFNNDGSAGIKRKGSGELDEYYGGYIILKQNHFSDSDSRKGDSGGSLYAGDCLLGTITGGTIQYSKDTSASFFVDLTTNLSRNFVNPHRAAKCVTVFEHAHYDGKQWQLFCQDTGKSWNDKTSSLIISPGARAVACEHSMRDSKFPGECREYSGSVTWVGKDFNDKISYVQMSAEPALTDEATNARNRGWCSHAGAWIYSSDLNADGQLDLVCHDRSTYWVDFYPHGPSEEDFAVTDPWCSHPTSVLTVDEDLFCNDPLRSWTWEVDSSEDRVGARRWQTQ